MLRQKRKYKKETKNTCHCERFKSLRREAIQLIIFKLTNLILDQMKIVNNRLDRHALMRSR